MNQKPWYQENPRPDYFEYDRMHEEDLEIGRHFETQKGHISKSWEETLEGFFGVVIAALGVLLAVVAVALLNLGRCFTKLLHLICKKYEFDWQPKPDTKENEFYFIGFGVAAIVAGIHLLNMIGGIVRIFETIF